MADYHDFIDTCLVYVDSNQVTNVVYINGALFDSASEHRQQLLHAGILGHINKIKTRHIIAEADPKNEIEEESEIIEIDEIILPTESEIWDFIVTLAIPDGTSYIKLDKSLVPNDQKYFREAWTLDGSLITIPLDKARSSHIGQLRVARNRQLDLLDDWEFILKSIDEPVLLGKIHAFKQTLRDVPQTINLSNTRTLNEIKNVIPEAIDVKKLQKNSENGHVQLEDTAGVEKQRK